MIRLTGLVGKSMLSLVITSCIIIGSATWLVFSQNLEQERDLRLQDMRNRCALRTEAAEAVFEDIERNILLCRSLYDRHLTQNKKIAIQSPVGRDGARRFIDRTNKNAYFMSTSGKDNAACLQQAAIANDILNDHGSAWCHLGGGMYLTSPSLWYAGWGDRASELVADMLPDDPILLPPQLEALGHSTDAVYWAPAEFEPASATWLLGAYARSRIAHSDVAIVRTLDLGDILSQATAYQLPEADALIIDRQGRILARSNQGQAWSLFDNEDFRLASSPDAALQSLQRILQFDGSANELLIDPEGQWHYAVTRLTQVGWIMVSIHSSTLVDEPAFAAAGMVLIGGLAIVSIQVLILMLVLSKRIARPLDHLVATAEGFTAGQRGLTLSTDRSDEIGDLSRAFTSMDISINEGEQKLRLANEDLREREERARALLESAADAVILIEEDHIVEANAQAGILFGLDTKDMLGCSFLDLADEEQKNGTLSLDLHLEQSNRAASGETCQYPWQAQHHDGHTFSVEIGLTRVNLPGPQRFLAVIRDVTERNRMQDELRQTEKMESIGQLAGGIAHDFNNLLAIILGAAELLHTRKVDSERREHLLTSIIHTCERAASLVSRLLTFSRRSESIATVIDVHTLLDDTLILLNGSLEKRIILDHTLSPENMYIRGDVSQIENALLNLGLNARDAMPDGGTLHYQSRCTQLSGTACNLQTGHVAEGPYLQIIVSDNGSGMSTETMKRIFEPFFTTKGIGKGTGLGLSAVYRTCIDHAGGIHVRSEIGVGTTFTLSIPLCEKLELNQESKVTRPIHGLEGMTVLLVDNEEIVRLIAREILEEFGMHVLEAVDGIHAVEVYQEHCNTLKIHVALIDAEMPRLRGIDCLKELRAINPDIKAILCSGFVNSQGGNDLTEAGFQAQLSKPYRINQIRACLEKVLF